MSNPEKNEPSTYVAKICDATGAPPSDARAIERIMRCRKASLDGYSDGDFALAARIADAILQRTRAAPDPDSYCIICEAEECRHQRDSCSSPRRWRWTESAGSAAMSVGKRPLATQERARVREIVRDTGKQMRPVDYLDFLTSIVADVRAEMGALHRWVTEGQYKWKDWRPGMRVRLRRYIERAPFFAVDAGEKGHVTSISHLGMHVRMEEEIELQAPLLDNEPFDNSVVWLDPNDAAADLEILP